jgi:hypothetical protein
MDDIVTSKDVRLKTPPGFVKPVSHSVKYIVQEPLPPRKPSYAFLIITIVVAIIVLIGAIVFIIYYMKVVQTQNTIRNTPATNAVLGQSCAKMQCVSPLICSNGYCVSQLAGPCNDNTECTSGLVCSNNQCLAGLFQPCRNTSDCAQNLVCGPSGVCVTV